MSERQITRERERLSCSTSSNKPHKQLQETANYFDGLIHPTGNNHKAEDAC